MKCCMTLAMLLVHSFFFVLLFLSSFLFSFYDTLIYRIFTVY